MRPPHNLSEAACQNRAAVYEVPILCLVNALATCGLGAMPLWVAAMREGARLSPAWIGWLASGEQLLTAVGVICVSRWGGLVCPRWMIFSAALTVTLANALAMFSAPELVIAGRLMSGTAMGLLLGSVTGIAARRGDAQRVLALMQTVAVALVSVLFFASPALMGRFGTPGLFGAFSFVGAVTAIAALVGFPRLQNIETTVTSARGRVGYALGLGCLALAVLVMSTNTIWTYIVAIGLGLGIDQHTTGAVLAIVGPLAMLGPIGAHVLGERLGLLRPILGATMLIAADVFFVVRAGSPASFCIYTAGFMLLAQFSLPYAIALLGRLDASGRFAGAAPAFILAGGAVGPALGARLLDIASFPALAIAAAILAMTSAVLFWVASRLGTVAPGAADARWGVQ